MTMPQIVLINFNLQTRLSHIFHISKIQPISYIPLSEYIFCLPEFQHISYISTNLTFQNPKMSRTLQHPTTALTNSVTKHISYILHLNISYAVIFPAYLIVLNISAYLLHSRIPMQLMEWNLFQ